MPRTFSESFFADAVVLVEGETDKIIIEGIADLLNINLDAKGISIVDVSSKENLRLAYAILNSLDVQTFIVVDGDALGAEREHKGNQVEIDRAKASHRNSTEKIINWLPSCVAIKGVVPYKFEDPTAIYKHFSFWHDDLESELTSWESFKAALVRNGGELRKRKDVAKYKAGVMDAVISDLPENLKILIDAISGLS